MTIESGFKIWSFTAAEDLPKASLHKVVSIGGTIAAGPSQALGVLRTTAKAGGSASAVFEGLTKVVAGAAVSTLGYPLKVAAASGYLIAAGSGDVHCGRALAVAASGDLIPAMVDFMTKPAWPGT